MIRENIFIYTHVFFKIYFLRGMSVFLKLKFILLLFKFWLFIMIDNSISDPKNKFELIYICILKFMNFLIFRNFLELFWMYLNLFFILKE